jgi:hypothetical protein
MNGFDRLFKEPFDVRKRGDVRAAGDQPDQIEVEVLENNHKLAS